MLQVEGPRVLSEHGHREAEAAGRALACGLGATVQTYSPSTQDAETGGLKAQG